MYWYESCRNLEVTFASSVSGLIMIKSKKVNFITIFEK